MQMGCLRPTADQCDDLLVQSALLEPEALYNFKEVLAFFGMPRKTLAFYRAIGLPVVQLGVARNSVWVRGRDLSAWIDQVGKHQIGG